MNTTKLFKRLLLVAAMMILFPQWAAAFVVGGLSYTTLSDGSVSVAGQSNTQGDIVIPEKVTYNGTTYSVKKIGGSGFQRLSGITSVTIANSIISIGDKAFQDCSGMTRVTIGNSVTSIGDRAFDGCSSLTRITIPNSVKTIGLYAFYDCTKLTYLALCNAEKINYCAFRNCTALKTIYVGGNSFTNSLCYHYNYEIFYGCDQILDTLIVDTNNWTDIKDFFNHRYTSGSSSTSGTAYYINFYKTKNLVIGESVTSIGANAFQDYTYVTKVNWKARNCANFTSTASSQPFNGLTNITSFTFSDEVQHIPAYLCYGLTGLTSVTIPLSVTSAGHRAFSGCSNMQSILWKATNCNDLTSSVKPFDGLSGVTSFTFNNGVQRIPAFVCNGLTGLTSMTIPQSVTSVGQTPFYGCTGLRTVTWNSTNCNDFTSSSNPFTGLTNLKTISFGNNVSKMPAYICSGLTGLNNVNIGGSIQTISNNAFSNCSSLQNINIPSNVTTIGSEAFKSSALSSLTIPSTISILPLTALPPFYINN